MYSVAVEEAYQNYILAADGLRTTFNPISIDLSHST
jgi:hypothetical protein